MVIDIWRMKMPVVVKERLLDLLQKKIIMNCLFFFLTLMFQVREKGKRFSD